MMTYEQKKIVKHKKGPAFVTAGPGTGKTQVLCCRAQHLIKRGVPAEKLLLLTFSKTAALNMETRLIEQFNVGNVRCSTTHAFGLSIVMEYWPELGFTAQPKVQVKQLNKQQASSLRRLLVRIKLHERNSAKPSI